VVARAVLARVQRDLVEDRVTLFGVDDEPHGSAVPT
jgi:hypothetical protein